jgi:hypothetical protein
LLTSGTAIQLDGAALQQLLPNQSCRVANDDLLISCSSLMSLPALQTPCKQPMHMKSLQCWSWLPFPSQTSFMPLDKPPGPLVPFAQLPVLPHAQMPKYYKFKYLNISLKSNFLLVELLQALLKFHWKLAHP